MKVAIMRILKKLNKADPLVIGGALSNLFYSIAYGVVHTTCIQCVTPNIVSLASLINCILAALVAKIWLDNSKRLYKTFGALLIIEGFVYSILTLLFLTKLINPGMYFIFDAILSAAITRNVICAGTRLKSIRYNGDEREEFDNKTVLYCNITSVIGFGFSSLYVLPTNLAFIAMFVGIAIDNIFYYYIFKKENKKQEEKEYENNRK